MTDQRPNPCAAPGCDGTPNFHPRYCDRCMQHGTPRFNEMAEERQRKRESKKDEGRIARRLRRAILPLDTTLPARPPAPVAPNFPRAPTL